MTSLYLIFFSRLLIIFLSPNIFSHLSKKILLKIFMKNFLVQLLLNLFNIRNVCKYLLTVIFESRNEFFLKKLSIDATL